ncbi:MAG: hypothetical protein AAGI91_09465 [Bacteroidota bacterium]
MPLLLLLVAVSLLAPSALAQRGLLDRGTVQLGGTVGFARLGGDLQANADGSRTSAVVLDPRFGFFLADRLALGTTLAYETTSSNVTDTSILTVGPNLSYYFGRPPRPFYPFVTALVGYSRASTDFATPAGDPPLAFRASGFALGAGLGVLYLVSSRVGVTGEGFFQSAFYGSAEGVDTPTANRFGLRLGAAVFLR